MKFKYLKITEDLDEEALNELGKKGYELVSVVKESGVTRALVEYYFIKRK